MRRSPVVILLLNAFFVALPNTSLAVHILTARYLVRGTVRATPDFNDDFGNQLSDIKVNATPGSVAAVARVFTDAAVGSYGAATATGLVDSFAEFGRARAQLAFNLNANNHFALTNSTDIARTEVIASATAGWTDTVRIYSGDHPTGTEIEYTSVILLGGDLGASASGGGCCAQAKVGVSIRNAAGNELAFGTKQQTLPATFADEVVQRSPDVIRITSFGRIGESHSNSYSLVVSGSGYANRGHITATPIGSSDANGYSRYGSTMLWGGITSVTNRATGEPISDWTIESDSGFDYSRAFPTVPEPSSVALIGIALGSWLWRARKRP